MRYELLFLAITLATNLFAAPTPVPVHRLDPISLVNPAPPGSIYLMEALRQTKGQNFGGMQQMKCTAHLLDYGQWQHVNYAPLLGRPGVYIFLSGFKTEGNNQLFMRMSAVKGEIKGIPENTLIPSRELTEILPGSPMDIVNWQRWNLLREIWNRGASGHNITGQDLHRFRQLVQGPAGDVRGFELNGHEAGLLAALDADQEFKARGEKVFLLGLGVEHSILAEANPHFETNGHELDHAHLYLDPEYKADIHSYWHSRLVESQRQAVRLALTNYANVEDLFIDEFQAYILSEHTELGPLKDVAPELRGPFLEYLKSKRHEIWSVMPTAVTP